MRRSVLRTVIGVAIITVVLWCVSEVLAAPAPGVQAWMKPPAAPPPPGRPVLVYRKMADDHLALGVVDASGRMRTLRLPAGAEIRDLSSATSPDGRYVALCNGAAAVQRGQGGRLTLSRLDLASGQVRRLTPLLSPDFPANFEQAAASLTGQDTGLPAGPEAAAFLQDAFWHGMCSVAWSPDGRHLAFAGQMEGLSSDLYLYATETGQIRRLSDELEQTQSFVWSPDSRWILHFTAYQVGAGLGTRTRAVAADGSSVKDLSNGLITFRGWVNLSTYLQWDVIGNRLQTVDIDSGVVTTVWSGTVASLAVDPVRDGLAIAGSEQVGRAGPNALFTLDLITNQVVKVSDAAVSVQYLGAGERRFIAAVIEGESITPFFVTAGIGLEETHWYASHRLQLSPDLRYVVVLGETLDVLAWGNNPVREIRWVYPATEIERFLWPPGSLTVFFTRAGMLYSVDLLTGTARDVRPVDRSVGTLHETDYALIQAESTGPEAVWDSPHPDEFADCRFESESSIDCAVEVMRTAGASPQAIEFTRLLAGEGFLESFEEHGQVDVVQVMYVPRPYDMIQTALVNGHPRLVFAGEDLGRIDLTADPGCARLAAEYPDLTIRGSLNFFERGESLPGGGQRLIIRYELVDGCTQCLIGRTVLVAYDFDAGGQFRGTQLVGLGE